MAKKTTLEKNNEWTNNSQQHCVIQIVIEKLAVHSKSQERAKKNSHFWALKTSMIHEFGHAKFYKWIGKVLKFRTEILYLIPIFSNRAIFDMFNVSKATLISCGLFL